MRGTGVTNRNNKTIKKGYMCFVTVCGVHYTRRTLPSVVTHTLPHVCSTVRGLMRKRDHFCGVARNANMLSVMAEGTVVTRGCNAVTGTGDTVQLITSTEFLPVEN